MKKIILLVLFFCFSFSNAQKSQISDDEIYTVINYVIQNGNAFQYKKDFKIITEDPNVKTDRYFDEKLLSNYFKDKDIIYIMEQFSNSKEFLLNPKYILNLRIVHIEKLLSYKSEGKSFWTEFNNRYDDKGFMFVGKPLFSLDKKRVVINYGYYCGGLCGKGSRIILKKINDTWVFEKEISGFIS